MNWFSARGGDQKEVSPVKTPAAATDFFDDLHKDALIADLQKKFIREVLEVLSPKDIKLVEFARLLAADKCHPERHKLAACGYGKHRTEHYRSLQFNVKRARESSVCAEAGVLSSAALKGDEISTIVTFHGVDQRRNTPYIVPPCALCITRLRCFAPQCRVIIEFEGALVKLPISAFLLVPYPMTDEAR